LPEISIKSEQKTEVHVIGGGLAGSEASLQLANWGYQVHLYEMRDQIQTPAHKTDGLAELVCSNSFKGLGSTSAHGLFKRELRMLGSNLMAAALKARVDAGESLTVDRDLFSEEVMKLISTNPNITLHRKEASHIPQDQWTIVAAGPLASEALTQHLFTLIDSDKLSFFDAIAPVVEADSIDFDHAYYKNRWDKGETKDFINCPLDKETYEKFVTLLVEADKVEPKPFEKSELFEGCLPVEEMASRGPETLRFGPMRPIGLMHPQTGIIPYGVVQLRAENKEKTLYNLVGFQTRLKWGTQKEAFNLIPALKDASFVRLGCMHRNTFIDTPKILNKYLQIPDTKILFAGQILGAEGYTEAVGTGLYAASQIHSQITQGSPLEYPINSCLGALTDFLTHPNEDFQPMNFNFGLLPRPHRLKKKQKKEFLGKQAYESILEWEQCIFDIQDDPLGYTPINDQEDKDKD
jgi:methylenetetrahydrofolate--tRNA-(uracil-5-)-methyltransferase